MYKSYLIYEYNQGTGEIVGWHTNFLGYAIHTTKWGIIKNFRKLKKLWNKN